MLSKILPHLIKALEKLLKARCDAVRWRPATSQRP